MLSRGEFLHQIPRQSRRAWGHELLILEDRSAVWVLHWRDQDFVSDMLSKVYTDTGLSVARLQEGHVQPEFRLPENRRHEPYQLPPPNTLVLALGDLGCLSIDADKSMATEVWLEIGRDLRDNGISRTGVGALSPGPDFAGARGFWDVIPWGREPRH